MAVSASRMAVSASRMAVSASRMAVSASRLPPVSYGPLASIDLTSKPDRDRLSPSALKAFFNMADRWKIMDEDARHLLGGVSNGPYYTWKKQPNRSLNADVLTRVSYLIGIFKALHILYGEKLADEWISLPNSNQLFGGQSPLTYMKRGGIPAMQIVRRLLDGRRGGA